MAKPLIAAPIDDDDDDIFGGVGDYEGPDDSDSNSENDDDKPTSSSRAQPPTGDAADAAAPVRRTNWFSTTGSISPSPSPPALTRVVTKGEPTDPTRTTCDPDEFEKAASSWTTSGDWPVTLATSLAKVEAVKDERAAVSAEARGRNRVCKRA